jgi:hypothetical protein
MRRAEGPERVDLTHLHPAERPVTAQTCRQCSSRPGSRVHAVAPVRQRRLNNRQRTLALLLSAATPRFDFGAPELLPSVQGRLLGSQRCDHLTACTLTGQQDSVNFVFGVLCHLAEEPQCLLHTLHLALGA